MVAFSPLQSAFEGLRSWLSVSPWILGCACRLQHNASQHPYLSENPAKVEVRFLKPASAARSISEMPTSGFALWYSYV